MASYYRNAAPGWGTSQYQFGPPPAPQFHPQPSWGGLDFYRAHAGNADPSIYHHGYNALRSYGLSSPYGVTKREARHWHRVVYGGLSDASRLLPSDLGQAAAYEAYRSWKYNSFLYEPLSGDVERQREGLIGLAIAESTRLLQSVGRAHGYTEASEAAAGTASNIFREFRESQMGNAYNAPRSRRGSFSSPYLASDPGYPIRERRHSFNSMRPSTPNPTFRAPSPNVGFGTPNPGYAMPIPQTRSHYGSPPQTYNTYNNPDMTYGSVTGNGIYGPGPSMQPGYPYPNSPQNTYSFPTQAAPSVGYGNAPGTVTTVPAGSTIVIPGKPKRHHHHSGSRHHRSRSQSIVIPGGYAGAMPGGYAGSVPGGYAGSVPGGYAGSVPGGYAGSARY